MANATVAWCFALLLAQGQAPDNPHLDAARKLYGELKYAQMVPKLERALTIPGNAPDQLCEIYSLLGIVHAILGNDDVAVDAFNELLKVNPKHKLDPELSPKILGLYTRVKREFVPPAVITFGGRPTVRATPGSSPWVEIEIIDDSKALTGVELWFRQGDADRYSKQPMSPVAADRYGGELPMDTSHISADGIRVEYVIVARGDKGGTLGVLGSMERPLTFTVLPGAIPPSVGPPTDGGVETTPWYATWWFWTVVGTVAAGTGVGLYFGLQGGSTDVPVGTLGEYTLDNP